MGSEPIHFSGSPPERMIPKGVDAAHTWSEPDQPFEVRSKTYGADKVKEPSGPSLLSLVDIDIVLAPKSKDGAKIDQFSTRPDSYARYLREQCKDQRRIVVIVFQMHPRYLIITLVETDRPANSQTEAGKLLDRLFSTSDWPDAECGQRLKLIPRIDNFSVPGVNLNRPTIIANKLSCVFFRENNLFEIDINVFSSRVAKFVCGYVEGAAAKLVVDLAFTIEGTTPEELPERTIGAVRLVKIDLSEEKTRKLQEA